jgi:hypothetical protein
MTEHNSLTTRGHVRKHEEKLELRYEDLLARLQRTQTEQCKLMHRLQRTQKRLDKWALRIGRLEARVQKMQSQLTASRQPTDLIVSEREILVSGIVLDKELQHVVQRERSATLADINQTVLHVQKVSQIAETNARIAIERVRYAEMRLEMASCGRYLTNAYEQDIACVQQAQRFVQDIAHALWTIEEHAAVSSCGGLWVAVDNADGLERQAQEIFKLVQQVDSLLVLVHAAIAAYTLTDEAAQQALYSAQLAVQHGYAALRGAEMLMVSLLHEGLPR